MPRSVLDTVIAHLELAPDATIADVGAGPGYLTLPLARVVPRGRVIATDIREAYLDATISRARAAGVAKHETRIEARAFVGTNTSLVAPVTIGEGAYVGAGSVITKDVPPGSLALERSPQVVKEGWVERRRARAAAGQTPDAPAAD